MDHRIDLNMDTMFNFLYELHNKAGECVVTQSVTGKRIAPMLEHISRTVNEQKRTHGEVTVHVIKSRVNESVLVDPKRMESLSTLVTMGVEHYSSKVGEVIVENSYPQKSKIVENLKTILLNPKKAAKLTEWMTAAQQERNRKIIPRKEARKKAVKEGDDTLKLPDLNTGDTLLVGKFKNRRAEIKGFSKDENNQPVADTTKGDQKIFKPRIAKIMPGAEEKKPVEENVQGDVRKHKEAHPEKYCKNPKPCPKHGGK